MCVENGTKTGDNFCTSFIFVSILPSYKARTVKEEYGCQDVNLSSPDVANPYLVLNVTTSASEVQRILRNLYISESPGVDNLPARILRTCARELSVPLTHLFSLLLKSGVMPTLWKSVNITPVHKGDNRELVENYRSIFCYPFLLSVWSMLCPRVSREYLGAGSPN